jgi:hypothetical protein
MRRAVKSYPNICFEVQVFVYAYIKKYEISDN